jgi:hypothetical protein
MAALPPSSDFTSGSVSEGAFKIAITGLRDFLSGLLGTTGGQSPALQAMGAPYNKVVTKTAGYTVIASDRGTHFDLSGTFTLALTAANTLGDGFAFSVRNSGSGAITVDPNGTETLDGSTTVSLAGGQSLVILCDGSNFRSVGKTAPAGALLNVQVFTGSGSFTYTPTAGVSRILVECLGPGAPGATGATPTYASGSYGASGAGGISGALRRLFTTNVVTQTVTIGASGGTTSFGSVLTAGQGTTGTGGFTPQPGSVGYGFMGGQNPSQSTGVAGQTNSGQGGNGGYGGYGGTAGYGYTSYAAQAGGAGGSGMVTVYEYA